MALLAKSLSVEVIVLAETLADSQNDLSRITAAYEDLVAGQAYLDANQFEEAVHSYRLKDRATAPPPTTATTNGKKRTAKTAGTRENDKKA